MPRKKTPQPCACGCQKMTKIRSSKLLQGHDSNSKILSKILKHIKGDVIDLRKFVEIHTGRPIL